MAKQLNVNLAFTADTKKVKTELDSLQKQLTNLINNANKNTGMLSLAQDIQKASVAATTLKTQLTEATNADTGKLDLGKFNESLKKSGMTIETYKNALLNLGPQGAQAFSTLAQSITRAELPLRRSSELLERFGTALKNTARWQISSGLLHGFMGSIQTAFHYAENLNESLNNIRIVTGYNTDQMAQFAAEANKAAQALSTTTTAYTNASLIYYQQGLSDSEVKERTDVTVKMANVTRQSAEDISQQMTAIWNNFDNGTKSLEYYSDAITALGAATASSSAEIAQGLEKFAAVADTVGLSYEYATAALATVTATTRQSADIVGNAFKTLFARLQSLKFDEKLDDGTDLTKYSKALEDVGINIKNTDGQLKEMDQILDELGAKWQTLSKNQQVALATTVAGVRQYTQLIALMDNWDFFQQNVGVASDSEGTLQKQADIYAESWEAAQKRVKAAAEEVYTALINDKFFIDLNNALAESLKVIQGLISGLGGVKGVLISIGAILITLFKTQMTESLENVVYSFKMMTEKGRQSVNTLRDETNEALTKMFADEADPMGEKIGQAYASQARVQQDLINNAKNMTEEQQKIAQILVDQHNTLVQNATKQAEIAKKAEEEANVLSKRQLAKSNLPYRGENGRFKSANAPEVKNAIKEYQQLTKQAATFQTVMEKSFIAPGVGKNLEFYKQQIEALKSSMSETEMIERFGQEGFEAFQKLDNAFNSIKDDPQEIENITNDLVEDIDKVIIAAEKAEQKINEIGINTTNTTPALQKAGQSYGQLAIDMATVENSATTFSDKLKKIPKTMESNIASFTKASQVIMSTAMAISSINGIIDTWNNKDMSSAEKLLATMTTLGMLIPMLTSAIDKETAAKIANTIATTAQTIANEAAEGSFIALAASTLVAEAAAAPLLVVMVALVAIIAVLVVAIKGISAAFEEIQRNSPEGKLEAAKAEAKALEEAFSELKQTSDGLISSFDQYDSVVKRLEECTRGTEEWAEAFEAVNEQVLTMLDEYPELLQYVQRGEDGLLFFSEEDINTAISAAKSRTDVAQYAYLEGKVNLQQAELNVDTGKIAAQFADIFTRNVYGADNYYDEYNKAILLFKNNIQNLADLTQDEYKQKLQELGATESTAEALVKYQDEINKLAGSTEATASALENIGVVVANQNLDSEKYSETAIGMAGNAYQKIYDKILDDIDRLNYDINKVSLNTDEEVQNIWKRYNEALGTSYELSRNGVRGSDTNRTFAYLNDEGEEVEVTKDQMAATIAASEALNQLEVAADQATATLNKLQSQPESVVKGLEGFIANRNFNDMTNRDVASLKAEVGGDAASYLKKVFQTNDLEELASQFGYDNAKALIDGFNQAFEDYEGAIDDIKNKMFNTTKKAFEDLESSGAFEDLSVNVQQSIANLLDNAFTTGGISGVDFVKNILDQLKPDELDEFLQATENIDWNTDSVDDFKDALKEAGVATNLTDEQLVEFIGVMKQAPAVIEDATERFKALHDVINELENGSTIEQEDYDALGGDLYKSFFLKMADGTYKLTTDAQTFYDVVNKQSIDNFKQNIDIINNLLSVDQDKYSSTAFQGYSYTDTGFQSSANFDEQKLNDQLAILRESGYELSKIAEWSDKINSNTATADMFKEIAEAINSIDTEKLEFLRAENFEQLASTAEDLDELHEMLDQYGDDFGEAFTKAAMAMDAMEDTKNLDPDELKEFVDYLQDAADEMEGFNKEMSKNEAKIVAKGIMKMNDAIDTLANNWEDWSSIVKESSESSEEYSEAMQGMRNAVADLLDINKEFVSSSFIKDNLEEIEKAANGDAEAIDNLKSKLSEEVIARIILDNSDFIKNADEVKAIYDDLVASIPDVDVGISLDGEDSFVQGLNELIAATGMTVDQVNALCDSLGFEANFAAEGQPVTTKIPEYTTHHEVMPTRTTHVNAGPGGNYGYDIEEYDEKTWTEQTGEHTATGEFQAFAMSTDGRVPKINSVVKKATGSANNYSSTNKGGTKTPGGKSKKGGKGKEPYKKDHTEDVADRYYDINNAISKINHELEKNEQIQKRLASYQDHYAGKTLIASLKKENDLLKEKNSILDKQYQNYEKLYEIQLGELGELKGKIGGNWNGNELTNYAELFQNNINSYNAAIDAYNAMSAEQQEQTGKQMVEDAKKTYDAYKEALDRYQKLYYNEMYDTENKLNEMRQQQLENQFKIIENNLKGWETEIQLKLDMTKMKREWKAFIHDIEQDFRKIYENLSIDSALNRSDFDTYVEDAETRLKQIADVEAELRKMDASKDANGAVQLSDDMMFGSISEAQEYLKKLQSELVDVGNSLNDMYEKVWDNYVKGLDQAKNNFEDINKEIEHLTKELEYEKQLIELIYGDKAYDMMSRYYSAQQMAIENQITSTRTQAQFWEDQLQKAYQMNKDKHNVNINDMSTWTEDMKKAYDEMIAAQEKLNDLVLEGIKNLKDEYLNNVAKTLQEMDKAIWGMDFDNLKEDWDFLQKKADEYLDDVEGAYKIQDLANKIDQSITDSSSLKAQQKLRDLREDEITMLREKEHLTQSDIDLAEARYQIALKELALEEAQNNKTSMKLTRDTSGNWTYQYVADEEEVTNKQQELLDAYANLYEIADGAYKHAMELAMEMYEEYKDKIVQIAEDTTISEEEKLQKMQELRDQYLPEIIAAMENAQIYEQETIMATAAVFAEVCEQDEDAYTTLTDLQKELVDTVRDQHLEDYEEIRSAILNNYQEIGDKARDTFNETNINSQTAAADVIAQWDKDNGSSVKGAMNDAFDNIIKYTQNFENELYRLEEVSGKTIMDAGGVVSDIDAIGEAVEEVGYKTEEMAYNAANSLDVLRGFVNEVESAWEQVVSKIQEAISALQEYLNMSEAVSAEEARRESIAAAKAANASASSSSSSGSGGGSESGGSGSKSGSNSSGYKIVSDPYGAANTYGVVDSSGSYKEISGNLSYLEKKYGIVFSSGWHDWMHFATGGYTGSWDDQTGKLAILHQKELVLNAEDTKNILETVNTVRDMVGLNDSIGQSIANSINLLIANAMKAGSPGVNTIDNSTNETSNNTFNITAEFPNANDVQTIRDAILSLPNIASQYVNSF